MHTLTPHKLTIFEHMTLVSRPCSRRKQVLRITISLGLALRPLPSCTSRMLGMTLLAAVVPPPRLTGMRCPSRNWSLALTLALSAPRSAASSRSLSMQTTKLQLRSSVTIAADSGTHTDVLEALGKHLPAHGRVTQACVCPPAGHPLPTSAEATKALALRSPAVASHGPPRPILS